MPAGRRPQRRRPGAVSHEVYAILCNRLGLNQVRLHAANKTARDRVASSLMRAMRATSSCLWPLACTSQAQSMLRPGWKPLAKKAAKGPAAFWPSPAGSTAMLSGSALPRLRFIMQTGKGSLYCLSGQTNTGSDGSGRLVYQSVANPPTRAREFACAHAFAYAVSVVSVASGSPLWPTAHPNQRRSSSQTAVRATPYSAFHVKLMTILFG